MANCRWHRNRRRRLAHAEPPGSLRLWRRPPAELSREARMRLAVLDWHRERAAGNVSRTCRHFAISRPTFYRWQERFDPRHPEALEDRSSAPRRRRRPTWTDHEIGAVRELRLRFPRWARTSWRCCWRPRVCSCRYRGWAGS
jgi:Winged helix-turn helix